MVDGAQVSVVFTWSAQRRIGQVNARTCSGTAHLARIAFTGGRRAGQRVAEHTASLSVAEFLRTQVPVFFAGDRAGWIGQRVTSASRWRTSRPRITEPRRAGANDIVIGHATAGSIAMIQRAERTIRLAWRSECRVRHIRASAGRRNAGLATVADTGRAGASDIRIMNTASGAIALLDGAKVAVIFAGRSCCRIGYVDARARGGLACLAAIAYPGGTWATDIGQEDAGAAAVAVLIGA